MNPLSIDPNPVSLLSTQINEQTECPICFSLIKDRIQTGLNRFYGHEILSVKEEKDIESQLLEKFYSRTFHVICQECNALLESRIINGEAKPYELLCYARCNSFGPLGREVFVIDEDYQIVKRDQVPFPKTKEKSNPIIIAEMALMILGIYIIKESIEEEKLGQSVQSFTGAVLTATGALLASVTGRNTKSNRGIVFISGGAGALGLYLSSSNSLSSVFALILTNIIAALRVSEVWQDRDRINQ